MRTNPHRTERFNVVNAARKLGMTVPALGAHIQAGKIATERTAGYTFVSTDEIDAFTVRRRQEFEADQQAEAKAAAQETRERDGAHIARLMSEAQELAGKHGWRPPDES